MWLNWRKSSASMSNGHCAEVASWRKSSRCAVVGVRDSQDPDGAVLAFSGVAWAAFLAMVRQT